MTVGVTPCHPNLLSSCLEEESAAWTRQIRGMSVTELCDSKAGDIPHPSISPTFWAPGSPIQLSVGFLGDSSRTQNRLSCVALGKGQFTPPMPDQCRALSSHGQILVCLNLMALKKKTSVGLILITPRDPAPTHRSVGTWQVVAVLGITWNCAEWPQTQQWHWVWSINILVNTTGLYLVTHWQPPSCISSTTRSSFSDWDKQSIWKVEAGGSGSWSALGLLLTCVSSLVLVEASLGAHLGPSHAHQGPEEAATNYGSLCNSKQVAIASHRHCLTLTRTRFSPKRHQNQHTQWLASDNIRAGSNELHKWHIQRKISGGTRPCWDKFNFVWSVLAHQLVHCCWGWPLTWMCE